MYSLFDKDVLNGGSQEPNWAFSLRAVCSVGNFLEHDHCECREFTVSVSERVKAGAWESRCKAWPPVPGGVALH